MATLYQQLGMLHVLRLANTLELERGVLLPFSARPTPELLEQLDEVGRRPTIPSRSAGFGCGTWRGVRLRSLVCPDSGSSAVVVEVAPKVRSFLGTTPSRMVR